MRRTIGTAFPARLLTLGGWPNPLADTSTFGVFPNPTAATCVAGLLVKEPGRAAPEYHKGDRELRKRRGGCDVSNQMG